jgi:(S)-ureidoglycine aminohydrolase
VFEEAYVFIPKGALQDVVTSRLPHWEKTRLWVLSRPLSGFAETFSQYIVEVSPAGGSQKSEPDKLAESVLFVVDEKVSLTVESKTYKMENGGYAFLPLGANWALTNESENKVVFHWIRKAYEFVDGVDTPPYFVINVDDHTKYLISTQSI